MAADYGRDDRNHASDQASMGAALNDDAEKERTRNALGRAEASPLPARAGETSTHHALR